MSVYYDYEKSSKSGNWSSINISMNIPRRRVCPSQVCAYLDFITPQYRHLDFGFLGCLCRAICLLLCGVCPTISISSISSVPTKLNLTILTSIVSTFVVVYHVSAWIFMLVNKMSALARFAILPAGVTIAICIVHADCPSKTSEQGT